MPPRAGVVVTGTEVLTGRVVDANGPWLAEQLRRLGVDIAQLVIVGDRPDDLRGALAFLAGAGLDLIITSGGLGPTADDLTAVTVGDFQGRPSALDPELEGQIAQIVDRLIRSRGWRLDPGATAAGVRKQAMVPDGASVLAPVGTAPGLVVPATRSGGAPMVVLPGPPRELQDMWPAVVADPTVRRVLASAVELRQRTMRLWGTPESELAATLREHEDDLRALEITTCLRDGELEVVTRYGPDEQAAYDRFVTTLERTYPDTLFSAGGATVDDLVADALAQRGLTIATAESCTGGLLAARLTERPGASRMVLGGVTAYANAVKQDLLDVDPGTIARHGAVSAEVARALADGVRRRIGADVGVGITGVAGPEGGTEQKPVGLVRLCVVTPDATRDRVITLPGNRAEIRRRAVVVALHLLRKTLGTPAG